MIYENSKGVNIPIINIFRSIAGINKGVLSKYENLKSIYKNVFFDDWYIKDGVLIKNPDMVIKGTGYESSNIQIAQMNGFVRFTWKDAPRSFAMSFDGSSMYYSGLNFYTKKVYKSCYIKATDYRVSSRTHSSVSVWYYPGIGSKDGTPLNCTFEVTRENSDMLSTANYEYGHSNFRRYTCNATVQTQYLDVYQLQIKY